MTAVSAAKLKDVSQDLNRRNKMLVQACNQWIQNKDDPEAQAKMRALLDAGVAPPLAKQQFADWTTETEAWQLVDRDLAALVAERVPAGTAA